MDYTQQFFGDIKDFFCRDSLEHFQLVGIADNRTVLLLKKRAAPKAPLLSHDLL